MSAVEFGTVVSGLAAPLRGFIRARVPDSATTDDVTQETLLKVHPIPGDAA